jgi:hypothetical protein
MEASKCVFGIQVKIDGEANFVTDPTPANIGIATPQINKFTEEDLLDELSTNLELYPIVPENPSFPRDTVPRYLVGYLSLLDFLLSKRTFTDQNSSEVRIFDFGSGNF